MPRNAAQWTGFAVTLIIVLGRDSDIFAAIPLGLAAGVLASLFASALSLPELVLRRIRRD
jgi:hypothetical protein